jgi:hypothetical protein
MGVDGPSGINGKTLVCAVVFLATFLVAPVAGATNIARSAASPAHTRLLTCTDDMGAGQGSLAPGTTRVGHVALIGVVKNQPPTLQRLGTRVLWYKTYLDVLRPRVRHIDISIRSLTGGKIGLDWGNQSLSAVHQTHYSTVDSLKVTSLTVHLCGNPSAGYPGGFVMTKPLSVQKSRSRYEKPAKAHSCRLVRRSALRNVPCGGIAVFRRSGKLSD